MIINNDLSTNYSEIVQSRQTIDFDPDLDKDHANVV